MVHDADALLRRASPRLRQRRHGDAAATTRPTTTASRWCSAGDDALWRRHPGAAHAHRAGRADARGNGKRSDDEHSGRRTVDRIAGDVKLARPMTHRRRLRQRRRRRARAASSIARLGCEVTELFCDVDGTLPEPPPRSGAAGEPRGPDRGAEEDRDAELGLAFDGDGDRLGVVTQGRQDHLSPTGS